MSLSPIKQFGNKAMGEETSTNDSVRRQFMEIVELMSTVNRRLEDCAVEWQSRVSRKQWRVLDDKSTNSEKSWEQSLLARTYFTDKTMDEAFQALLVKKRNFTDQLNYFMGLLRGEGAPSIEMNFCDAQIQCPDLLNLEEAKIAPAAALDASSLVEHPGNPRRTRRNKCLASVEKPGTSSLQQSFADLVKAKINLDTKFLGFEAVLSGNNDGEAAQNAETRSCLCQICSNVLGNVVDKGNVLKSIVSVRKQVQRETRARTKRLRKPTRTLARRKRKNQKTVSLDNMTNRAGTITNFDGETLAND